MKKPLALLFLLFSFISAQETTQRFKDWRLVQHLKMAGAGEGWVGDYDHLYSYDERGNNTHEFVKWFWHRSLDVDGCIVGLADWVDHRKYDREYYGSNLVKTVVETVYEALYERTPCDGYGYVFNGWGLKRKFKVTTSFNNQYDLVDSLTQDLVDGIWITTSHWSYSYNESNELIGVVSDSLKESISYDENGNVIEVLSQDLVNGNWLNKSRIHFTYSGNQNLTDKLVLKWNEDSWRNHERFIYNYNENNELISDTTKSWGFIDENQIMYGWLDSLASFYSHDVYEGNTVYGEKIYLMKKKNTILYQDTTRHQSNEDYIWDENWNLVEYRKEGWAYDYDWTDDWLNLEKSLWVWEEFQLDIDGIKQSTPSTIILNQCYPNPFNPSTTISYDLPEQAQVTLGIYDILGKQIKTLVNQSQYAGKRIAVWDSTDDLGRTVSAGVYLYRIQAGEFTQTRKMLLLK